MSGPLLHRECLICPLKNELIVGNMDAVCDKRKFAVITNKNTARLKLQKKTSVQVDKLPCTCNTLSSAV